MSGDPTPRRRTFLKKAGALGAAGYSLSFAGCLGGSGGGDGDGGGSTDEVSIAYAPPPWNTSTLGYAVDEGILEQKLNDAGYDLSFEWSWEDVTLFASGQVDVCSIGPTECAFMATQRDMNLAHAGRVLTAYGSACVRTDGEFDPANTGGREASIQKVADEGTFGIGGWEGGEVKIFRVLFPDLFDLQFREEGGDFDVQVVNYGAQAQLIVDGELDCAGVFPSLGGVPYLRGDPPEVTSLWWVPDLMVEAGYTQDAYGGLSMRQEFADANPDAVTAIVEASQEALDWFHDDPVGAVGRYREDFGVEDDDDVRFIAEHQILGEYDQEVSVIPTEAGLSDDWIQRHTAFLDASAEMGDLPDDWADRVEFLQP